MDLLVLLHDLLVLFLCHLPPNPEASCSLIQCVITEFSLPQFPPRTPLDSLNLQISEREKLIGLAWDKVLPASYGQPINHSQRKRTMKAKQAYRHSLLWMWAKCLFLKYQGIFQAHIHTLLLRHKEKQQIRTSLTENGDGSVYSGLVYMSILCYEKKVKFFVDTLCVVPI